MDSRDKANQESERQNNPHQDIDEKIKAALSADDAELFAEISSEQNPLEQLLDSFRGSWRWFNIMAFVAMWLMFFVTLGTGYMFYIAESQKEMIGYGGGFFFSLAGGGMMKLWFWMEMNKNAVTREIKRVELQIASLAARLPK